MMSNRCYKGGYKHNFQLVYDEKPRSLNIQEAQAYSIDEIRSLLYYKVYVCSICSWCGKTIKKEN